MEVLCLTDLYNTLGQHGRAIEAIKRGWRWLQGRAADKFWDACEDDREFDLMEDVGSTGLGAGGGGTHRERDGDVRPGWYPLDVNARHRLAIARIKMGDVDEGKVGIFPPFLPVGNDTLSNKHPGLPDARKYCPLPRHSRLFTPVC